MTQSALITGVAGGIGSAIARRLSAEGWNVSGVDRQFAPDVDLIRFRQCDLGSPIEAHDAITELAGDSLDLLVNAAAIQRSGTVLTSTLEDWDHTFAVNVRGAFVAIRAAYSALRFVRGAIVNIGSIHSRATSPGRIAYVSAKGALSALTRACALELAPDGIRVNALLPGAVSTPMLGAGLSAAEVDLAQVIERTPLRRVATTDEIASAVFFLAEGASFMTGQELVIDGGATARLATE